MPGAVTGPVSISTLTGTVNSDSNFTVTSTPYPGAQQGNKLIGTGNVSAASQGVSVAVSADGNTAIVGGYSDNGGIGAVWVYVRAGSTWTQQGNKLVGSGSVGASHQGISVAVSADGKTAIVGGRFDNSFRVLHGYGHEPVLHGRSREVNWWVPAMLELLNKVGPLQFQPMVIPQL
ncbi:MAG: hypothetical protein IPP46_12500 [Bacteroidetes bacterium]|nr:hypothetical protein [Bacteroidota bacterium]